MLKVRTSPKCEWAAETAQSLAKPRAVRTAEDPDAAGRRRAATSCARCSPAERRGLIDPARPSSLVFQPYLHPGSRPPSFSVGIFNCQRNCHLTFHGYACISCREKWEERKELRLISNSSRPTSSFPSHLKQNKTKKDINSRISPYFSTEKSAQVTPFGKFHAGFGAGGLVCLYVYVRPMEMGVLENSCADDCSIYFVFVCFVSWTS